MKIISVCYDDYANLMYNNMMALRSVGIDCESYKIVAHPFNYSQQSRVVPRQYLNDQIKRADIVQIFHSDEIAGDFCRGLKKKTIVYHTGTRYRMNPEHHNNYFNFVERALTDQTEFIGLGMKNEAYIATAIDTDLVYPVNSIGSFLRFAHFPSNPDVKGTTKINDVLKNATLIHPGIKYFTSNARVNQFDQYKRMQDCDAYIELWANENHGKEYGCYGVTAFEAAAMGKIVITQNLHPEVYFSHYGCKEPFYLITDEAPLDKIVENISNTRYSDLRDLQAETRQWIVDKHSYQATGNYLKKLLDI